MLSPACCPASTKPGPFLQWEHGFDIWGFFWTPWLAIRLTDDRQPLRRSLILYKWISCIFYYFWLHWVFVSACRLSLVAASWGFSPLWCAGFLLPWLLVPWRTGCRHMGTVVAACRLKSAGLVVVVHGLHCFAACEIFPDRGSNLCPLHWQADSYPLDHHETHTREFLLRGYN